MFTEEDKIAVTLLAAALLHARWRAGPWADMHAEKLAVDSAEKLAKELKERNLWPCL